MPLGLRHRRDFFGGIIIALFGLVAILEGHRLGTGSLTQMGAGFVPMALGFLLLGLGVLMAAKKPAAGAASAEIIFDRPEWRGWFCIILGVVSFLVLGLYAGLVPAAFCCVFLSALGDRTASVKGAAILAAGVTVFGVVLFHYMLAVPIPLFGQ